MPLPRRRTILLALAAALVSVAAWALYTFYRSRRPYEWAGTVESRTIGVGSRTGGRVAAVLVREGDIVDENQPLVRLEPGDLDAQRTAARGQLLQAEAELARLARTGRRGPALAGPREQEIAAAEARLAEQEANVARAGHDFTRAQRLFQANAGIRADVETNQAALRAATAARDAQRHTLDQLRIGTRDDVAAAQGAVQSAQGHLAQIEIALDELTIRAPRPSRVEALDLRPGDLLAPSATALTLFEPDQLFVRIYVPETELGHVRVGQRLPVRVDSFPRRTFSGIVEHIARVGEYTPRNLQTVEERSNQLFPARVGLGESGRELRAGMSAFVRVPR